MPKRHFISILALAVLMFGCLVLGFRLKKTTPEDANNVNTSSIASLFENHFAVSPDGKHVAALKKNASGQSQQLILTDIAGNSEHVLSTKDLSYSYQRPLWNSNGNRLYFAYTRENPRAQTTLSFIDLNDPDPYVVTEIVYTDAQGLLNGITEIVGENGNLLYVKNGTKLYQIDLDQGINASPVLLKDLSF